MALLQGRGCLPIVHEIEVGVAIHHRPAADPHPTLATGGVGGVGLEAEVDERRRWGGRWQLAGLHWAYNNILIGCSLCS